MEIRKLNLLAARGLVQMFDAEKQLFCHRLVRTERGLVREGLSPRYTIMTLLGLRELEQAGGTSPFDTQVIYESLAHNTGWIRSIGDLGLMVWVTAAFAPDHLEALFRRTDLDAALDQYADARHARTTELAWFLSGLTHAAMTSRKRATDLTDLAVEAYHRMEQNQGEYGFFGHMAATKSVAGILRGRIGSFADQIYPVYAMSKFATAFEVEEPLDSALECASALCNAQGELGQWWWLYDSKTGRVSSRYPVYSVHQQGMAPMALLAVEEASQQSFKEFIYKGLRWIYDSNELGTDMRDLDHNLIWRCILPKRKQSKYWDTMLSVLRSPKENAPAGPLEILYEDRPYELGWLLYAFAKTGAAN
ncbi:MAG: hypothetical protein WA581_10995 [Candidatus Acidiferrales bacterium]